MAVQRRVIVLAPDAFGGRGGIALYLRHFLRALCSHPEIGEVIALPRAISYELEAMPSNLRYVTSSSGSLFNYAREIVFLLGYLRRVDLIVCGHLHLLPFAKILGMRFRCPVLPLVYGVEAWTPTGRPYANRLCRDIKSFVAIRRLTAIKFMQWSKMTNAEYYYLPNCIDETAYGTAPKSSELLNRYNLRDRVVIMTTGRLDPSIKERRKGFDELLEALPTIAKQIPNVSYVIVGDGDDRRRLEEKTETLGVKDRVIFTGYVPEAQKADHLRLADVFAMPGSNTVFDRYPYRFAFLEALACGIPVVAAELDDAQEAADPDASDLIIQVNPSDKGSIMQGILQALSKRQNKINPRLKQFYYSAFEKRAHEILSKVMQ